VSASGIESKIPSYFVLGGDEMLEIWFSIRDENLKSSICSSVPHKCPKGE
jgi:hypothetical protein